MNLPGTEIRIPIKILVVLGVVTVATVVWSYLDGWGASQWSSIGSWVAGAATLAAVWVALWQIKLARDDAAGAKTEADARLTRELDAADARLTTELTQARADAAAQMTAAASRQTEQLQKSEELLASELDAQRRMEQIRTLPPIWDAISNLADPFVQFRDEGLKRYATHTPKTETVVDHMKGNIKPWLDGLRDLEMVFTPALMTVSETNAQQAVTKLYEDTRKLLPLTRAAVRAAMVENREPDFTELNELRAQIHGQRKAMTNTVREHLSQVPPMVGGKGSEGGGTV